MSLTPKRNTIDQNANTSNDSENTRKVFPYPDCWKDDERMQVLLAPFRVRSVNPTNYDSKMKFWQDIVATYCVYKGAAHFCKNELQLQFSRGQRIPYGLDTVLQEMQHAKKIRTRAEYEYDPENGWTGWAINSFVRKPLAWGFYRIKSTFIATDESKLGLIEYVHLEAMKKFCTDLQTQVLEQQQGKLLHYESFKRFVTEAMLQHTEDCLQLCLHTLHYQRKIGLEYTSENKQSQIHLIKIPSKTDTNIAITDADHAIHNLQMTQKNLLKQLEDLEDDIKINETKAREYLKENKRQMAKTYLRKKHLLEKNHEKRSVALHNIETLLCSVEEAQSNGEILDAYKIGSNALKNALNESGLKYDNVDEVISEVRDTIEAHNEVQNTLANASFTDEQMGTSNYDNDELELELKEIMGESDDRQQQMPKTAAANNANNNKTNTSIDMPRKIEITDAELLAMLEGLEVEENSPTKSNSTQNTVREQ